MNQRSLDKYYAAINAGCLPVEREFVYAPEDWRLGWLFQSMQEMKIDRRKYATVFHADVVEEFTPIWDELESRGWIEVTSEHIRFVDIGAFHIPMLQALISYARLEEIRIGRSDAGQLQTSNVA